MEQIKLRLSRSRIILIFLGVIGAVFVVRLFFLQVLQHDYYEAQAIQEHTTKYTIPATRGRIYALNGASGGVSPLVLNETVYTVYADPRYVKDSQHVVDTMRRVAGGNTVNNFENGLSDKNKQYTVLARQVSKAQAELIKKESLDGVGFQAESKRVYPEDQLAAQVLGFVNSDGEGQYGVEQALNGQLAGKDGQLKATADVRGIPISVGASSVQIPPQDGADIVLTIDANIQSRAEKILADGLKNVNATKGSVVVMDPNNGHILAMVNLPSYNPNNYRSVEDYTAFQNRAVSDPYEPGSVMKTFTMATGLDTGTIQPNSTFNNQGFVKVQDATITNVDKQPLGTVTMTQVLQFSFNTGSVQVLKWLGGGDITPQGKQKLYDYLTHHYLFGKQTGVQLAGEASGMVPTPSSDHTGDVRYANMSFGQGMNLSMLQVTSAFAAVINGGTYYQPQIVDGTLGSDSQTITPNQTTIKKAAIISQDASAKLRQMLHDAREGSVAANGETHGYFIGGKTGTAQVYNPSLGQYDPTATIGSYLGFGGQDKPQYVIMVRVDDAKVSGFAGSSAAAPIFTQLSNWMCNYLQIQPRG